MDQTIVGGGITATERANLNDLATLLKHIKMDGDTLVLSANNIRIETPGALTTQADVMKTTSQTSITHEADSITISGQSSVETTSGSKVEVKAPLVSTHAQGTNGKFIVQADVTNMQSPYVTLQDPGSLRSYATFNKPQNGQPSLYLYTDSGRDMAALKEDPDYPRQGRLNLYSPRETLYLSARHGAQLNPLLRSIRENDRIRKTLGI